MALSFLYLALVRTLDLVRLRRRDTTDLAIEVISPTNLASAVLAKVAEYFQHGVRFVWVVYPIEEQVYVYDSVTSVRILTRADRLAVPSVLPGFELALESLFESGSPAD